MIDLCVWLLTTKGHNMAAVFMNKFPGDSFLHNLLHLSMTQQLLDDSFINMPQIAHKQSVKGLLVSAKNISENNYEHFEQNKCKRVKCWEGKY